MRRLFRVSIFAAGGAALALAAASAVRAQGSPPMNTNDPVVVGRGNLEVNFGFAHARSAGARDTECPIIDLNYGLTESAQLSYVVAWLGLRPADGRRESGLGNSTVGVKWRFHDGGEAGPAMAFHPQCEFNHPGSSSARRGLVDRGATLVLPLQWQRALAGWTLTADAGGVFHFQRADHWFFGVSAGRDFGEGLTLGVELFSDAEKRLERSALLLNFGGSVKLSGCHSLLFAAGREFHRHDGPRASFVGYLGWQVRR